MAMQSVWLRPNERDNFEELREKFAAAAQQIGFHVTTFTLREKKAIVCVEGMTAVGLTILLNQVRGPHS